MTEIWYQVEFHSKLEDRWIPLLGRCPSIEDARRARRHIKGEKVRIVHITRTIEVVE